MIVRITKKNSTLHKQVLFKQPSVWNDLCALALRRHVYIINFLSLYSLCFVAHPPVSSCDAYIPFKRAGTNINTNIMTLLRKPRQKMFRTYFFHYTFSAGYFQTKWFFFSNKSVLFCHLIVKFFFFLLIIKFQQNRPLRYESSVLRTISTTIF